MLSHSFITGRGGASPNEICTEQTWGTSPEMLVCISANREWLWRRQFPTEDTTFENPFSGPSLFLLL